MADVLADLRERLPGCEHGWWPVGPMWNVGGGLSRSSFVCRYCHAMASIEHGDRGTCRVAEVRESPATGRR